MITLTFVMTFIRLVLFFVRSQSEIPEGEGENKSLNLFIGDFPFSNKCISAE